MDRLSFRLLVVVLAWALAMASARPAWAQLYVGVYGGAVFPEDSETKPGSLLFEDISNEALEEGVRVSDLRLGLSDTEFDAGWLLGGRVGYWLQRLPFLAVEGELYSSFPTFSEQDVAVQSSMVANGTRGSTEVSVPVYGADMEVLTLGLNLIARYPYGSLQPYGGAGVGLVRGTIEDVKLAEDSTFTVGTSSFTLDANEPFYKLIGKDDWVWALQLTGGLRGFVSPNVALFVEYKYVNTKFEFQPVELDYDSSHLIGGVEFFLGPGVLKR